MKAWLLATVLMFGLAALPYAQELKPAEPKTVAVWPFDSQIMGRNINPDERLLLNDILPDLIAAELSMSSHLRLVERQRLGDVLNEQRLGASELADETTRLRLGRLLGAALMIFGSYMRIGESWQIDTRMVDVESAHIVAAGSESGQNNNYLSTAQSLAAQMLKGYRGNWSNI